MNVLMCSCRKSGGYLLYRIISTLMINRDLWWSYTEESGLCEVLRETCSGYFSYPEQPGIPNILFQPTIVDTEWYQYVTMPERSLVEVRPELVLGHSSFIWTHSPPLYIPQEVRDWADVEFYLIRDGREVIDSFLRFVTSPRYLGLHSECKLRSARAAYEDLDYFCKTVRRWTDWIEMYQAEPETMVRFENLTEAKFAEITRIVRKMGLAINDEEMLEIGKATNPAREAVRSCGYVRNGGKGWRDRFTPEHMRIFKEEAGATLVRLGYETGEEWSCEF